MTNFFVHFSGSLSRMKVLLWNGLSNPNIQATLAVSKVWLLLIFYLFTKLKFMQLGGVSTVAWRRIGECSPREGGAVQGTAGRGVRCRGVRFAGSLRSPLPLQRSAPTRCGSGGALSIHLFRAARNTHIRSHRVAPACCAVQLPLLKALSLALEYPNSTSFPSLHPGSSQGANAIPERLAAPRPGQPLLPGSSFVSAAKYMQRSKRGSGGICSPFVASALLKLECEPCLQAQEKIEQCQQPVLGFLLHGSHSPDPDE